jgi:hypothetical protein
MRNKYFAIAFIGLVLQSTSLFSQRIAMYDIIGTTDEVIVPFIQKLGFKKLNTQGDITTLTGVLNNEKVDMILYQTPMTHLVYKVIVESNQLKKEKLNKTEWDSSKTAFNRKFKQLVNRYGVAEQIFETNGEIFERKKCKKPYPYKASWVTMQYFQNLSLYCELQKTGSIQVTYIVKNNLLKYEQEIKMIPAGSF